MEPATAKGAQAVNAKPETGKAGNMLSHVVGELEKGQVNMDKLIQAGASGKNFSNAELLSLQAGMYKYTQELDLTSKVVEKATSGLKDTLKTQV
ncbi:ATP-dependent helicase HrpB [Archangium primigenium]|nr:ATP-dependent helicase HrpB [Archangium primigenium]